MGYSTIFIGKFKIDGDVTPELYLYLNRFFSTRRMQRDNEEIKKLYPNWKYLCYNGELGIEGEYFVPCDSHSGQKRENSITDYNKPPKTQPGLWCGWEISIENGEYYLVWNGQENFYNPREWLQYIIDNFIIPNGLSLTGVVNAIGELFDDVYYMVIIENSLACYSPDDEETVEMEVSELKSLCSDKDYINICDEILSHVDDINTLRSPDMEDKWWEIFYKLS